MKSAVAPFRTSIHLFPELEIGEFPSSSRGGCGRSSLFYSQSRPAPVPRERLCQENGPTSARRLGCVRAHLLSSSSSPRPKPGKGTRDVCAHCAVAGPGTRKMVSGSCSARMSVCVCVSKGARVCGVQGVRCVCARLREGLAAAGAGTDSPGGAQAAPHTKPLASPLTPTPPTPLSCPHPPRPLPSSLIGQWDKSFCGDGWALTSRAELSHLGIPGAVRMLQAAG